MDFFEWLRIIFIGIVEGITEWLPISSTGHMILVNAIWKTHAPEIMTEEFWEMFEVVIQLGAILAVVTIFWNKLWPFGTKKTRQEQKGILNLWGKVIVGCIPAGIFGVLLDDWMNTHLYNEYVVAAMLIVYGVGFILVEQQNRGKVFAVEEVSQLTLKTALLIGVFQILSLVPGTSRSGVTILGAMLLGCSRYVAAEFTFYVAIPVMFGASGLKVLKYLLEGSAITPIQTAVMIVGMAVAYAVSVWVIKFLMGYIKKNDFTVFGWYRILLGIIVLGFFLIF